MARLLLAVLRTSTLWPFTLFACLALAFGCRGAEPGNLDAGAGKDARSPDGRDGADGAVGQGGTQGIAVADGGAGFKVTIAASAATVCPGQCIDLTATAFGGTAPYRFSWDHQLGDAAQATPACPTRTTSYTVRVSDTSLQAEEFQQASATTSASLSINVAPASACGDAGSIDGSVPIGPMRELCSFRGHTSMGAVQPVLSEKSHQSVVDSQGNVIVTGAFKGKLSFGDIELIAVGDPDGFVIKLDADCHVLWAKSFGNDPTGQLWFASVVRDETDQLYLAGGFVGKSEIGDSSTIRGNGFDAFLMKLDADGKLVWSKVYSGSAASAAVTDLVLDTHHRLTMVGYAGADTSFGGAPLGFLYASSVPFLAQLDTNGSFVWSRAFTSPDLLFGLANDASDDSLVLTGWGGKSVDLGAGALSLGNGGRFLAKLSSAGQQQWLQALPHGADVDQWNWWKGGVSVDAMGGIVVLRDEPQTLPGNSGARVIDDSVEKYSPTGAPTWQTRLSDATSFDQPWGSALTLLSDAHPLRFAGFDGTTVYAGQTLVSRGVSDIALVELDASGQPLHVYQMGGALDDIALGVTVDAQDHIFASYVSIENESGEATDLVVVKLSR